MAEAQRLRSGQTKRNIETTFSSLGGFCGWKDLMDTYNSIKEPGIKRVFNGLFTLGCRRLELPTLTRGQVLLTYQKRWVRIRGMYVEKQKETVYLFRPDGTNILRPDGKKKFKFESKPDFRSFNMDKKNPMVKIFSDYVRTFPNKTDKDKAVKLYPYTGQQIYYRIAQIGMKIPMGVSRSMWTHYAGPWWPHRIRAERACQLIQDRRFNVFRLLAWFGWSSQEMAILYGKIQGFAIQEDFDIDYK